MADTCWLALGYDTEIFTPEAWSYSKIVPPAAVSHAAPKRQAEFLSGRLCAREVLRTLTGEPSVPAVSMSKAPSWPPGIVGSITHSGGLAAALVASATRWRSIGQDAEILLTTARAERLAAQILTPNERQWLSELPPHRRGEFVTLVFSLKESLFKALFPLVGVRFYFQDAEISDWDDPHRHVTLNLLTSLSHAWPAGSQVTGHYAQLDRHLFSLVAIST